MSDLANRTPSNPGVGGAENSLVIEGPDVTITTTPSKNTNGSKSPRPAASPKEAGGSPMSDGSDQVVAELKKKKI